MSRQSRYALCIMSLLLTITFLIMPYLVSDLAKNAGLSINEITWGLSLANCIAAISLYARPRITNTKNIILLYLVLLTISTIFINVGNLKKFGEIFLLGVILIRIVLVNFSDINRKIHINSNTKIQVKSVLAISNIISNIISCSVPVAASFILYKYHENGLEVLVLILSLIMLIPFIFFKKEIDIFNKVLIEKRKFNSGLFKRIKRNAWIYVITLITGIVLSFIYTFVPLIINKYAENSYFSSDFSIGLYFTINSVIIVLVSIPILNYIKLKKIQDLNITYIGCILSIFAVLVLLPYKGSFINLIASSIFMAISEIVFIPFILSYINSSVGENDKDNVIKDITLISVSISAILSAPIANVIYKNIYFAGTSFCGISVFLLLLSKIKLGKYKNEKSYSNRSN